MKKRSNLSTDLIILRQKAEILHKKTGLKKGLLTESEITKLIHELEVHQIELEMQNNELCLAKFNAEVSSQKYSELYDFAPTGYFTLSKEGKIIDLNLCGSQLLGKERSYLKNRLFITFVSQDTRPVFNLFLQKIFDNRTKETCEISLSSKEDTLIYLQLTGNLAESGDQCIVNAIDISERRQIQKELEAQESHNRTIILHTAMDGFYIIDLKGYILEVNEIYCQMSGYSELELIAMHLSDLDAIESDEDIQIRIEKIILQGEDRFETQHRRKDGSTFDVEISTHYQNEAGGRFVAFLHDISERKMAEKYREMSRDILQILNEPGNIADLIKQVITLMKEVTGVEAVGIRLKKGEDFPYFIQEGFSNDFLSTENSLIEIDSNGIICRDSNGNSCLVCNCGLVISGKNDPGNPFFTRGGSWWTNNLSQLPDTQYGRELRFHPRNKCIHQGFDSLALIPIRNKDKIVGLIQLNDFRKDRFTLTTIEKLEGIASHIGTALIRSHSEELLRRKEEKRISILQTAMDGFWILNSDRYILEVNDTYCNMSGYSRDELLSLNVSDLECEENEDDLAAHGKEVIEKGKDRFETRHRRKDGSIFDVEISTQYRPAEGQFVSFLRDITDNKRSEDDLRYHAGLIENVSDAIISTDENFRVKSWNKAAEKIYGWKSEETVGKSVAEILCTEYLTDTTRDESIKILMAKNIWQGEVIQRRKDNSSVDILAAVKILKDKKGQFIGSVSVNRDITEMKKSEAKLIQSEGRYKSLFQNNHSVMLLIDPDTGEIKDANPAACKYYGWSHTELTSKNISEINTLVKADIDTNLQNSKAQINNHLFFQHRLSDGEIRSVEVYSGPIKFGDSTLLYSIVHDITDSKLAQEALINSELKFRKYIDHAPHGIFVANEKGDYVDVNLASCKITGYTRDELLSMKIIDLVPEESIEGAVHHFNMVVNEGFATGEFPFIRKDRSKGYWSVDAVKLSDTLFLGFVVDISMRKKAEESLIESEHRYHSLFEESNDAIFLVELATGRYLDCNRMAETLTGYTQKEILQMSTGALLPVPRKGELAANRETIMSGKVLRSETMIAAKNGSLIPVEFNSSMVTINDNQCILSMVHDISERKAAEEALRQSEERVRFKLQSILSPEGSISDLELNDIIDVPSIQKLMDNFYELAQIPMAIIDNNGKVLVGAGWQDICTKFHRVNPESCRNCIESDIYLTQDIPDGEFRLYKCKNNMWDMATPIIIGGERKGNLFMGQFFLDSEPIEHMTFRKQAEKYGFAELEYMNALDKAPRISEQKLEHAKAFFLNLSLSISQLSYGNIKLARAIAQQKIIEDALRESEESLEKAQEIAHLGSWSLDLVSNRLTWSDEIYRIFGLQQKDFSATYEAFLDVIHPEDRDAVNSAFTNSILENQDSYEIEHRIIPKDSDNIRYVYEKCEHQRDKSGKIVRSVGMVLDITERKLAKEAILENERLLRESQSVGNIGSYSVDLVERTWKASTEVYKIFGIDDTYSHSLDGWINCLHPKYKNELVSELFNFNSENDRFEHEYKIYRINDGEERWVQGLGKFESDDQHKHIRMFGTIQDITGRKLKEEALRKLNQTLAALGKSSMAMSLAVDELDYLNQVCSNIVEDTEFTMVWIGFAEDDEAKTVRPVASAGFNDDYLETIKISWNDSEFGHGPTGVAIRTGKMSICNNMLTDPNFKPWREQALKRGFASSIVFPLKAGDKSFGAISIYSKEPDSFFEDEIKLLSELSNDLAQGITTIRLRKAHQLAEEALIKSHSELEILVKERTCELEIANDLLVKEIDIRRQQEQNLKVAEEKYRTVADFTHDWEYWISPENKYNYISPSCENITGYKAEEFIQNPGLIFSIVHPDDQKVFHAQQQNKIWSQNYRDENQFRIIRSDGSVRWIGNVKKSVYDESGNFIGIRGSNRDITERKNLEQQLKTNNRKYRLLSENITDGIFICQNGSFEYVNKAMNHLFGYDGRELIGLKLSQLVLPEYLEELDFISSRKATLSQIRSVELECFKKGRSIIFVEFLFNYLAEEGIIYGVVHDITEKKLIQKNIVKAIILTEEKERAYFSKELHDGLGPLLSTIKLYLQWSERSKNKKSREEIIGKAEDVVEDAILSVKEISNKLSPHLLTNYGLCSAIQSFINKLQETSAIQFDLNCNIGRRLGNEIEAAIYRAIIECINNTIKHSGAKMVTIYMHDSGDQLEIQYRDNGIGFNLEESFAVKKGLGLFNLQNRIQNIGGKISMFSEPGKGVDYQIIVSL